MNETEHDMIIKDLNARKSSIAGFITETEDGKLQIITYKNGVVSFISDKVDVLYLAEQCEGNTIRPIGTMGK